MEILDIQKLLAGVNLKVTVIGQIEVKDKAEKETLKIKIDRFLKKYAYCESIDYLIESLLIILNEVPNFHLSFLWSGIYSGKFDYQKKDSIVKQMSYQTNSKSGIFTYNSIDGKENFSLSESTLNCQGLLNVSKTELLKIANLKDLKNKLITTYNEKTIIKIYQMFYGRNPDFLSDTIYDEIKNMLWLLSYYGYSIEEVDFYMDSHNKIQSNYLKFLQHHLAPQDLNSCFLNDYIKFDDLFQKTIIILKEFLIKNRSDEEISYLLNRICLINYATKWKLKSKATDLDISHFLNIPIELVRETLTLTRKIDEEVNK